MDYATTFLVLACLFGFFMAWGIGANDVANAMGTSVGSGTLTIKQAIIVAAIFEFSGAYLAGGQVTKTIRKEIIDPPLISNSPELLVYGILAALLAAGSGYLSPRGWVGRYRLRIPLSVLLPASPPLAWAQTQSTGAKLVPLP